MLNIILFMLHVILSVAGMLFIKLGGAGSSFGTAGGALSVRLSFSFLGGACAYVVSFLLYILLLQRMDLSRIAPVSTGSIYVLTVLASLFVLRESISAQQWIGLSLIFAGILLAACPPLTAGG